MAGKLNKIFLTLAIIAAFFCMLNGTAKANESFIEINLDILDDFEQPARNKSLTVEDFNTDTDAITNRARAKVEEALDTKAHILKPQATSTDFSTPPSNSYSSGGYVSPYKSMYDNPETNRRGRYTPPQPTVSSYESYLEKYRNADKGEFRPYLSDSFKRAPTPPTPRPTETYQPEIPIAPQATKPIAVAPPVQAVPTESVRFEPLEDYPFKHDAAPTQVINEPEIIADKSEIIEPILSPTEREEVKQSILKSIEDINKIEAPTKQLELETVEIDEKTIVEDSAEISEQPEKTTPLVPEKKPARRVISKKVEDEAPSIFDNREEPAPARVVAPIIKESTEPMPKVAELTIIDAPRIDTTPIKSSDIATIEETKSIIEKENIILDRNIPIKDEDFIDITKTITTDISDRNDAIATADITSRIIRNEPIEEVKAPEISRGETIAQITTPVAKTSVEETNQYAQRPVSSQPSTNQVQEITRPNIYAQRANESMGARRSPAADKTARNNISQPFAAESAQPAATSTTQSTLQRAQTALEDISRNVGDITQRAADSVKNTISRDRNRYTETDAKETLVSLEFLTDSSELTDEVKAELDYTAEFLEQSPNIRVQIRSFAESKNRTQSDARRMSLSRGLAVRSYLTNKGIKPVRLDIRALGDNTEKLPIDRVDIVFLD